MFSQEIVQNPVHTELAERSGPWGTPGKKSSSERSISPKCEGCGKTDTNKRHIPQRVAPYVHISAQKNNEDRTRVGIYCFKKCREKKFEKLRRQRPPWIEYDQRLSAYVVVAFEEEKIGYVVCVRQNSPGDGRREGDGCGDVCAEFRSLIQEQRSIIKTTDSLKHSPPQDFSPFISQTHGQPLPLLRARHQPRWLAASRRS